MTPCGWYAVKQNKNKTTNMIPETTYLIMDQNVLLICTRVFVIVILFCIMWRCFLLICASPIGCKI